MTLSREIFERLLTEAVKNKNDIVSASINEIYNGDIVENRINDEGLNAISGIEAASLMFRYKGGIRTVIWDKIFSKEVLKDVSFTDNYKYGEDTLFNFKAFLNCERYGRISYVGYTYDHRMSQVTGKRKFDSTKLSNVYVIEDILRLFDFSIKDVVDSDRADDLLDAINFFRLAIYRQLLNGMFLYGDYKGDNIDEYSVLRKAALSLDKDIIRRYLSAKDRLQWWLYIYWPGMYMVMRKINHLGEK